MKSRTQPTASDRQGAGEIADELAATRHAWSTVADRVGGAFGYIDLGAEYRAMVDAWYAEIGTVIRVLDELSRAESRAGGWPTRRRRNRPARAERGSDAGSASRSQVRPLSNRLGILAIDVNPLTVPRRIAEAVEAVVEPPPGDPIRLRQLAKAFDRARRASRSIAEEIQALSGTAVPDAWRGEVGGSAAHVVGAAGDIVGSVWRMFGTAARALRGYADTVEDLQRRHDALRRPLPDLWQPASKEVFGLRVRVPDPVHLRRAPAMFARTLLGAQALYRESLDATDELSRAFGEVAGRALAHRARQGGRPAAEAVLITDTTILLAAQLTRAGRRRTALAPAERARLDGVLSGAGSVAKRAYLLKAFAAGHTVDDVVAFHRQIRRLPPTALHRALNLVDTANPGPVVFGATPISQIGPTCGLMSMLVAHTRTDPIFAFSLTGGVDVNPGAAAATTADPFLGRLGRALDDIGADVKHRTFLRYGTPWTMHKPGITAWDAEHWMNEHADVFGTVFRWHETDDARTRGINPALRAAVNAVDEGHPVLVFVNGDHEGHCVLIIGHRGDELQIYEPAAGVVTRAATRNFLTGTMTHAAVLPHVVGVIIPARDDHVDHRTPSA